MFTMYVRIEILVEHRLWAALRWPSGLNTGLSDGLSAQHNTLVRPCAGSSRIRNLCKQYRSHLTLAIQRNILWTFMRIMLGHLLMCKLVLWIWAWPNHLGHMTRNELELQPQGSSYFLANNREPFYYLAKALNSTNWHSTSRCFDHLFWDHLYH